MNNCTGIGAPFEAEITSLASPGKETPRMRKYRVLGLMFSLMLIAAACSGDSGETAATTAVATTAVVEDGAHETGEEVHENEAIPEDEEVHDDEATPEDEEATPEDEEATPEDEDEDHEMMEGMSPDNIPEASGPVTSTVTMVLTEFGFEMTDGEFAPGATVRLVLDNTAGLLMHEVRLTTAHKAEEHVASGHEGHGEESAEGAHHEDADILVNVAAGETRTVEMTLPTDVDAIDQVACLIPGHYEAGMFTDVDF